MPCPTCNHTMQNLGVADQRIFWCPRCGTVKSENGDHDTISRPFRCQRFDALLAACQQSLTGEPGWFTACRDAVREASDQSD